MSSSISNSDPAAWRGFLRALLLAAGGVLAVLYGFVALVDPWGVLPLSPPLPRVPISTNARFSFPALARSQRFDSAILGTSTARLLQPAMLDPPFHARFVNLAMNAATAWEQSQLLAVFTRAHPHPKVVVIGLDAAWCDPVPERLTPRPFPAWMYGGSPWRGYWEILTPYAVQEAANQFAVMVGLKRRRYGLDGYTSFVPPDRDYDPARVAAAFARWPPPDTAPAPGPVDPRFPALGLLRKVLAGLPAGTRKVLFFTPYHVSQQGAPGSATAERWAECKRRAAAIAGQAGAELLDWMVPSPITRDRANYWDPLHYRVGIAERLSRGLALGEGDGTEFQRLR